MASRLASRSSNTVLICSKTGRPKVGLKLVGKARVVTDLLHFTWLKSGPFSSIRRVEELILTLVNRREEGLVTARKPVRTRPYRVAIVWTLWWRGGRN